MKAATVIGEEGCPAPPSRRKAPIAAGVDNRRTPTRSTGRDRLARSAEPQSLHQRGVSAGGAQGAGPAGDARGHESGVPNLVRPPQPLERPVLLVPPPEHPRPQQPQPTLPPHPVPPRP